MVVRAWMAGVLIPLLVATACLDSDCADCATSPDEVAAASFPIIGGTPESGYPAVGALMVGGGLCTGTLIAPRVVLTAAHCVVDATPSTFILGSNIYSSTRLAVQSAIPHPDYRAQKLESSYKLGYAYIAWHDIAVAILKNPSTETPMPLSLTPATSMVNQTVTFVGFGNREPYDGYAVGQKYKVSVPVYEVWSQGFWNVTSSSNPKMTCGGDSGGPAFINEGGVERIMGVVSSGDEDCVRTGYNTRLDTNLTWVNQQIAAYGGTVIEPKCGDSLCNGDETPYNCPQDCGEPKPACGDGTCNGAETRNNCPQDCGQPDPWCGDYRCNGDETPETCPNDCKATGAICGNGTCEEGETPEQCPGDCPVAGFWAPCDSEGDCGDGLCLQVSDGMRCSVYCAGPDSGLGCPSGFMCAPLASPPPSGDGVCVPSGTTCGDGLCGLGEAASNCPVDCRAGCGDVTGIGCCDGTVLTWCSPDNEIKQVFCGATSTCGWADDLGYYECGRPAVGDPAGRYPIGCGRIGPSCGDGTCDSGETPLGCPADCRQDLAVCGNGTCESGEDCLSCPGDCTECNLQDILKRSTDGCAASPTSATPGSSLPILLALALLATTLRLRRRLDAQGERH